MKQKKWMNNLFYVILTILVASLLYNHYLLMVNQGKADSIEFLKNRVIKEMVEKYDSINHRDSIIINLQDSIESLNHEE